MAGNVFVDDDAFTQDDFVTLLKANRHLVAIRYSLKYDDRHTQDKKEIEAERDGLAVIVTTRVSERFRHVDITTKTSERYAKLSDVRQTLKTLDSEFSQEDYPGLYCPITHEVFIDPVSLGHTGRTYERAAIMHSLQEIGHRDPVSNELLDDVTITPNYALRDTIESLAASLNVNRLKVI